MSSGIVTAADGRSWVESLAPALHRQAALLRALVAAVDADTRWVALELGCSVAQGRADELSDVDIGLWHGETGRPDDDEVTALVRSLGEAVEVSTRPWDGMPRWWVQYADGAQLDLVVGPAADRPGYAPGGVVLLDRTGRLATEFVPSALCADREEQRGWLLGEWEALGNVAKYVTRGSLLEAVQQVHRARDRVLQLQAAQEGVPYPVFGLTSLLDGDGELPEGIEETYPAVERGALLRAALELASQLGRAADAAEPPMTTPLADFVRGRLVALEPGSDWFAVRCVFLHGPLEDEERTYEERITVWRAPSAEVAMERAEAEAEEYAGSLPGISHLGLLQSYWLPADLGEGAEVFSLMRDRRLGPQEYLAAFFDAGTERQTVVPESSDPES